MLLAAGALLEWGGMIQILLWIIAPVFFLAFIATWIYHYRHKRKQAALQENEYALAFPESISDGAHLLFDHTGLLRQYRNKLSYNLARYRALQQDFEKLQVKYSAAAGTRDNAFITHQTNNMEKTTEQWEETIRTMTATFEQEKQLLHQRLEQLDKSYRNLESENELLVEQISLVAATGEEKELYVNRWRGENQVLRERVNEQAWIVDLLEEKKRQVEFLQSQLEQRIKSFHQADQGRDELAARLQEKEKLLAEQSERFSDVQNRLDVQQQELDAKAIRLDNVEQEFSSRDNHIIYLENTLKEIKDQNEMLHAEIADRRNEYNHLQQQREDEQQQLVSLKERLAANKQLLLHLHKEISACVEGTSGPSQVVVMRPAYIHPEQWEETAMP